MSLESFNKMKQKQGAYLDELGAKLAEMDHLAMVDAAEERGVAKGKAEGLTEGMTKVAMQMLQKGCSYSLISEVTGLSKAKISRLKG